MTAQEWDERFEAGTSVPVRCSGRITLTRGLPRDTLGTVCVARFERVPLSALDFVSEDEARAEFRASAEADLRALATVRESYPVEELELAHRDLLARTPTLLELHAHMCVVARLWSRWQGDVYAD